MHLVAVEHAAISRMWPCAGALIAFATAGPDIVCQSDTDSLFGKWNVAQANNSCSLLQIYEDSIEETLHIVPQTDNCIYTGHNFHVN